MPVTVDAPVLTVTELSIYLAAGRNRLTLVDGVNLSINVGQSYGLVGESGSGKSLTMLALMGLLPRGLAATCNSFEFAGQALQLGSPQHRKLVGSVMTEVFQDPFASLNPCYTVGYQLCEVLQLISGLEEDAAQARAKELLVAVGISAPEQRLKSYPHQLSGGMIQRVMIAMALAVSPRLLIADEPTTALDVTIQAQILDLIRKITAEHDMSLIMISHNLAVIAHLVDRIGVMYAGKMVEEQATRELILRPRHPYTSALLHSLPERSQGKRLNTIPGRVPDPGLHPTGCVFHPRCSNQKPICRQQVPQLQPIPGGSLSCFNPVTGSKSKAISKAGQAPASDNSVASSRQIVLQARNLVKHYTLRGMRRQRVHALEDISFQLQAGETLGLVGESGSGKSTLARLLTFIEAPTSGTIELAGRTITNHRKELGQVQMIFQDPFASLNPRRKIAAQLQDALRYHTNLDAKQRQAKIVAELEQVGLAAAHADCYPHMFSGGQRQRLAMLRATIIEPKVLIADEPVSALDISVQGQIINMLLKMQQRLKFAMLLISHDLSVVRQITDQVMVIYLGRIVEIGATEHIFNQPRHPYTRALLDSSLSLDDFTKKRQLALIKGELPSAINPPSGCVYHPRCPYATAKCRQQLPLLSANPGKSQQVSCWHADKLEQQLSSSATPGQLQQTALAK